MNGIEDITSLKFKDKVIDAIIFEGISQSRPMKFRASYDDETKKATIIHESLHRISGDNMLSLPEPDEDLSLGLHKQIYLVLYDLWVLLYGKQAADRQVSLESSRTPMYKDAWDWALSLSKGERTQGFAKLCK